MKIEKLNENKLKITLSIDDLAERNIDLQSFIYNSPESQDLFWDMMQEAEKEYGFNFDESMIYVEASAIGSGLFTLIVTKSDSELPIHPQSKSKLKAKKVRLKRKSINIEFSKQLYLFQTFDDICAFCKTADVAALGENSLYKFEDEYYLLASDMPFLHILNFATLVKSPELFMGKINEYGSTIIENTALQEIGKHFIKTKHIRKK